MSGVNLITAIYCHDTGLIILDWHSAGYQKLLYTVACAAAALNSNYLASRAGLSYRCDADNLFGFPTVCDAIGAAFRMRINRIAFEIPEPYTFNDYNRRVWDARSRALTKDDYRMAANLPRDGKRSANDLYLGLPYALRHAARHAKAGRRQKSIVFVALAAGLLPVELLNVAMGGIPGLVFASGRILFGPWRPRSAIATREDVVTRSMFELSRIVGSFAGVQQYQDIEHQRPLSRKDLVKVLNCTEETIEMLEAYACYMGPRITESRLFEKSLRYLKERHKDLSDRIAQHKRRSTTSQGVWPSHQLRGDSGRPRSDG